MTSDRRSVITSAGLVAAGITVHVLPDAAAATSLTDPTSDAAGFPDELVRIGARQVTGPGVGRLSAAVAHPEGEFGYFACRTTPAADDSYVSSVAKVPLERLLDVDEEGFPAVDVEQVGVAANATVAAAVIDPAGSFGYFGIDTTPGTVVKLDLSDLSIVGTCTFDEGVGGVRSAVIDADGTFGYFGTGDAPGRVIKVRLDGMTVIASLTLNAGENDLRAAVVTSTHAYFGTNTQPARVVKVSLSDLARTTATEFNRLEVEAATPGFIRCAVADASYAYFGTSSADGATHILRVALSNMAGSRLEILDTGGLWCAVADGAHAYFGTADSPGEIIKVRLGVLEDGVSALAEVDRITLDSGEGPLGTAITDGSSAYFGTDTAPALVVKV